MGDKWPPTYLIERAPLSNGGIRKGSDEHGPLIALVDIYTVYEGFNLNPSRLFNIRQHYLV